MGFFNNLKYFKDKALEHGKIQNIEQLQFVFEKIDNQAKKEDFRNQKEREYFNKLNSKQKIAYKHQQKRNQNLKRLGLYGLTVAGMATGVGIPVLMAANVGRILSDDDLTFNNKNIDEKIQKNKSIEKTNNNKIKKKIPLIQVKYDKKGMPKISTLVDNDPYDLDFRFKELIRE